MCEIIVVLVEPEHPGNVGATARLIKNFMGELVIVNPKFSSMDEAYARAKHGRDVLEKARIVSSLEEALSDVDCVVATTAKLGDQYHVFRTAITPQLLAEGLKNVRGRVAILFGRESIGLTNEELKLADIVVTIPTSAMYPTLNLSHAVAIILYELFKALSTGSRRFKAKAAGRVEREQAIKFFREIIQMLGYRQEKIPLVEKAFKNIISRAWISGREIYTLLGVLRKIRDCLSAQLKVEE
ncbi:MAG: RNA methyltransferase [Candidatus Jordarchaeales archaeon]|nr:RNA methyltransferase [Candidatus Jordarchaeia archaeon]